MTDGRSWSAWVLAGAALIAAAILVLFTVFGMGFPAPSLLGGEERADDLPDAEIEFHPNPDSMTVYFAGGGPLPSSDVYMDVDGSQNLTWAAYDVDLEAGGPLDAGEEVTIEQWSEGQSIQVYYQGTNSSGVIASYDP